MSAWKKEQKELAEILLEEAKKIGAREKHLSNEDKAKLLNKAREILRVKREERKKVQNGSIM
jgi:hypothetical protein